MLEYPTEIVRFTVLQDFRTAVEPSREKDRWVQIVVPSSSVVMIGMDEAPEAIGLDRVYKMPRLSSTYTNRFPLMRGQHFCLATESGMAECTLILSELVSPGGRP